MKFKDLEYFQQLAKLKSYTKTAAFFQVKQPTITYAVKRLEEEVQTELLVRNQSHAQIQLTPAGQNFSQTCPKYLKRARFGQTGNQSFARGPGALRITANYR